MTSTEKETLLEQVRRLLNPLAISWETKLKVFDVIRDAAVNDNDNAMNTPTTKCTTCGYLSQGNTEHSCLDILRAQVATEQQRVVYEQEMHNALHSVAKAAHDYYHNGASSTPLVTALEALKQKGWKP